MLNYISIKCLHPLLKPSKWIIQQLNLEQNDDIMEWIIFLSNSQYRMMMIFILVINSATIRRHAMSSIHGWYGDFGCFICCLLWSCRKSKYNCRRVFYLTKTNKQAVSQDERCSNLQSSQRSDYYFVQSASLKMMTVSASAPWVPLTRNDMSLRLIMAVVTYSHHERHLPYINGIW